METDMVSKRKNTILIADDSAINREMLSEILGDEYNYIYAQDGEKTLKLLSSDMSVDILLLDMNMPKVSGMSVLKIMREKNWLKEIPVVIISAEQDINFIKNAYYLGATDYIVRPFNAFFVQHRVKNTIEMYSQKKHLIKMVESQVVRREKMNNMLINIFSHVVELGNHESGRHTLNVQTITSLLLNRLIKVTDKYSLSESDISMISSVSALHDIGKITIPDKILNKNGRLTEEEWKIMKTHTTKGDKLLYDVNIDQSERFMIIAHEICRHHHERYDGNGYPDRLAGDDIPISAQAVSIADVYDALTSERCYKEAYPHERAVSMILSGECGVFNPLLLKCFEDISDELIVYLNFNEGDYDVDKHSHILTNEVFEKENLQFNDYALHVLEVEKCKKEFFADRCRGIQFEYDAIQKKVLYIKHYNENGERTLLQSNVTQLLNSEDLSELFERISQTTRDNPNVEMVVLVPIKGDSRWNKLSVSTIWSSKNSSYVGIVGQFTDIHEEVVSFQNDLLIENEKVSGMTVLEMRKFFDIVRIIDPKTCDILKTDKDSKLVSTGQKCYNVWNREECCKNCMLNKASNSNRWVSKLEIKDGLIYAVLSRSAKYNDVDCVLEIAFCIDESLGKSKNKVGFYPENLTLKNFYRDSLTKTYSRTYLESFMPDLEKAKGVAIADIDEFKKVNDTYGHIVGDATLRHISNAIKSCIRKEDILIRYGGDEFLLVFDNITEEDFFKKIDEIKQTVQRTVFTQYPHIKPSISIGGAYSVYPFEKAIDVADKAMYKDKFKNKN